MNLAGLVRDAASRLGADEGRFEAERLLMHVLRCDRAWLFAHPDAVPEESERQAFEALVRRREQGEPLAYLTGRRGFWTLDLAVSEAVLIPRAETELLVETALNALRARTAPRVLDLGTGSGAIALALAAERPDADVLASDISDAALSVAAANAGALGLQRVRLVRSRWFDALSGLRFDLIVSNPPYLAADDPHLERGDLPREPRSALVAGEDGLEALREIVAVAPSHLAVGGWLAVEHGAGQGAAVRAEFIRAGLREVATRVDIENRERVTAGMLRG